VRDKQERYSEIYVISVTWTCLSQDGRTYMRVKPFCPGEPETCAKSKKERWDKEPTPNSGCEETDQECPEKCLPDLRNGHLFVHHLRVGEERYH
jgi:hypothetical protein